MINSTYKYSEITAIIIGCAMKVHNTLGMGFPEVIYQRALHIEINKTELKSEREVEHSVYYEGELVGKRRVDFLINSLIPLEIKAIGTLDSSAINQILNYLEAFNLEIGLLINFGNTRLEYKRLTNNKFKSANI